MNAEKINTDKVKNNYGMTNNSHNGARIDDYGTFFYKLRNGSLPFEYDTSKSIDKITESINGNHNELVIGVISAIIADLFRTYLFKEGLGLLFYIELTIFIFIVLKYLYKFYVYIKKIIEKKKEKEKLLRGSEIQDLFYRKILVQTTYVFSVVKRIQELGNINDHLDVDNNKLVSKRELVEIYSMQGIYGIRKVSSELSDLLLTKSKKNMLSYIDIIGEDNFRIVIRHLYKCLNIIMKCNANCLEEDECYSNENCVDICKCKFECDAEIERLNDLHEALNSLHKVCRECEFHGKCFH